MLHRRKRLLTVRAKTLPLKTRQLKSVKDTKRYFIALPKGEVKKQLKMSLFLKVIILARILAKRPADDAR